MSFKTEQEGFWATNFGNEYTERNHGVKYLASKVALFADILKKTNNIGSIVELGCNRGVNLQALKILKGDVKLYGYEINPFAARLARELSLAEIVEGSILDPIPRIERFDLAFTSGVLIHINPEYLHKVYENLFNLSSRYILICEYYNPTPVAIEYRGHKERLFKRDFAGEMIESYSLRLVDYGFVYHRDNNFALDDGTWFLLEK
jgi:pseudaminic acid biosynthesis-associated methylase